MDIHECQGPSLSALFCILSWMSPRKGREAERGVDEEGGEMRGEFRVTPVLSSHPQTLHHICMAASSPAKCGVIKLFTRRSKSICQCGQYSHHWPCFFTKVRPSSSCWRLLLEVPKGLISRLTDAPYEVIPCSVTCELNAFFDIYSCTWASHDDVMIYEFPLRNTCSILLLFVPNDFKVAVFDPIVFRVDYYLLSWWYPSTWAGTSGFLLLWVLWCWSEGITLIRPRSYF